MAEDKLVGLVFEAWGDMDRVLAGLTLEEMSTRWDGGSSFAWTLAHATNMLDALVNVRFLHLAPHALIGLARFRIGGDGVAEDWPAIETGVGEVRATDRDFLQGLSGNDLDLVAPYDGSLVYLRENGLSLRYALLRIAAHDYYHTGEIASKRIRLGHDPGRYPGLLLECL